MIAWYELNYYQIDTLIEILDDPLLLESITENDWYINFVKGIRYDIIRKKCISEKQLYQIKKLAAFNKIPWTLSI